MSQQQENRPQPQDHHERAENLRVLLEHHWRHCQHIETERYWFMSAYAVVVGAVVSALMMGRGIEELKALPGSSLFMFLVIFLSAFTFFGFFLTLRWTFAFECHRQRVNALANFFYLRGGTRLGIDPTMNIPSMSMNPLPPSIKLPAKGKLRKMSEVFKGLGTAVGAILRMRYVFSLFYLVMLIVFVWFASFPLSLLPTGFALVALWLLVSFFWSRPR